DFLMVRPPAQAEPLLRAPVVVVAQRVALAGGVEGVQAGPRPLEGRLLCRADVAQDRAGDGLVAQIEQALPEGAQGAKGVGRAPQRLEAAEALAGTAAPAAGLGLAEVGHAELFGALVLGLAGLVQAGLC